MTLEICLLQKLASGKLNNTFMRVYVLKCTRTYTRRTQITFYKTYA